MLAKGKPIEFAEERRAVEGRAKPGYDCSHDPGAFYLGSEITYALGIITRNTCCYSNGAFTGNC